MPLYEFRCDRCGERFEELVAAGTDSAPCQNCGAEGAVRVLSAQAAPFGLVKSIGAARRQEGRNAELRQQTKADFKARRQRAHDSRGGS